MKARPEPRRRVRPRAAPGSCAQVTRKLRPAGAGPGIRPEPAASSRRPSLGQLRRMGGPWTGGTPGAAGPAGEERGPLQPPRAWQIESEHMKILEQKYKLPCMCMSMGAPCMRPLARACRWRRWPEPALRPRSPWSTLRCSLWADGSCMPAMPCSTSEASCTVADAAAGRRAEHLGWRSRAGAFPLGTMPAC